VLENDRASIDGATSHRAVLSQLARYLQTEFSNKVCLSCIGRPSENNILDCGHSLCDSCVVIHGRTASEEESVTLDSCPLCRAPNTAHFVRKPSNAGVRVLSIAGHPGDMFALSFLKKLETELKLPGMHIGDNFDIAVGTGSGSYGSSFKNCG
jgi:hypothetical protein